MLETPPIKHIILIKQTLYLPKRIFLTALRIVLVYGDARKLQMKIIMLCGFVSVVVFTIGKI